MTRTVRRSLYKRSIAKGKGVLTNSGLRTDPTDYFQRHAGTGGTSQSESMPERGAVKKMG